MTLNVQPNFHKPGVRTFFAYSASDEFYQSLTEAHAGLTDEASDLLNAKLVLLLANHIGDLGIIDEAIAIARGEV